MQIWLGNSRFLSRELRPLRLFELAKVQVSWMMQDKSPTLARSAAPLSACVQRISSMDKTDKKFLVAMTTSLERSKTNFSSMSYTATVLPNLQICEDQSCRC